MAVEDDFAITIFDEETAELRAVGDLLACVAAHRNRQLSSPALASPSASDVDWRNRSVQTRQFEQSTQ